MALLFVIDSSVLSAGYHYQLDSVLGKLFDRPYYLQLVLQLFPKQVFQLLFIRLEKIGSRLYSLGKRWAGSVQADQDTEAIAPLRQLTVK